MSDEAEVKAGEAASASVPEPKTDEAAKPAQAEAEQDTEVKAQADAPDGTDEENADPASVETEDEGEKPKRAPRNQRYQRKIAALQTEVDELRRREAERSAAKEPPKEADFNGDFEAFNRAMIAHDVAEALRKEQAHAAKGELETRQRELAEERSEIHLARVAEARKLIPDYDAVLQNGLNIRMPEKTLELIMDSEKSAHVAYYLAKHPESVRSLAGMTTVDAARYLGGLETRLSLPKPKTTTTAPAPIAPPKGGAAPVSQDAKLDGWLKKTYGAGA